MCERATQHKKYNRMIVYVPETAVCYRWSK